MGHANISMTMRYAHVSPSALRGAVEVLEYGEQKAQIETFEQPVGNRDQRCAQEIEGHEKLLSIFSAQSK